jgi:hypothetical protein
MTGFKSKKAAAQAKLDEDDDTQVYKKLWVGLTREEILDLFDTNNVYGSKWIEFARSVETKLKEKNT